MLWLTDLRPKRAECATADARKADHFGCVQERSQIIEVD
jgi:hypothetical protein